MENLRFGLLVDGISLQHWQVQCLDRLLEFASLAAVIQVAVAPESDVGTHGSTLIHLYASKVDRKRNVDCTKRFAGVKRFEGDNDREGIERLELDFVLKLGRGSIPKWIYSATRHGVWCFRHDVKADFLPYFREVYDGEDVTEDALLALTAPDGDALILEQGCFGTDKRSYVGNLDRVQTSLAEWPARVCRWLSMGEDDRASRTAGTVQFGAAPNYRPQFLRFCARIAGRRLRFAWQRLFRHPQWNIGVLRVPAASLLRPGVYKDENIEWFPLTGRERFLADPFGIVRDRTTHILCEDFGYRGGKGRISALDYSDRGFTKKPQPAIELPVHMSYPFLIEDAGEIYCIPETCYADEVALFRAVAYPRRWSKVAVLVEHFGGLDPTVFRHAGRWWLMCTEKGRYADVELWIWHATDLSGPWTAHARNPVKTDVRNARPGGAPFVHEGVLYRPSQDCSRGYGWRIAIQRVISLTPTEFVEEQVTVLEASADSPFPLGRHTLTPVGEAVLIDGHRAVFVWHAFRSFLRICAGEVLRKLRRRPLPTRRSPAGGQ